MHKVSRPHLRSCPFGGHQSWNRQSRSGNEHPARPRTTLPPAFPGGLAEASSGLPCISTTPSARLFLCLSFHRCYSCTPDSSSASASRSPNSNTVTGFPMANYYTSSHLAGVWEAGRGILSSVSPTDPKVVVQFDWRVLLAQSVKCLTLVQVMISQFLSLSPTSGSLLPAQSPLQILCLPLSLPLPRCLCLSKINTKKKKGNLSSRLERETEHKRSACSLRYSCRRAKLSGFEADVLRH